MSYDSFSTNCPHFAIGCCTSFKTDTCQYKVHNRCKENFLCNREDCKLGHGITPVKRMIINKIYDLKYNLDSPFENTMNPCRMAMNCINNDCTCDHHLLFKEREFIYKIVNPRISDEQADFEFNKVYGF